MRRDGDAILYSPSDLTEFLESEFASWMSRLALEHPERVAPSSAPAGPADEIDAILRRHGERHETEVLEALRAEGREVVEIPDASDAVERTLEALRAGREIVYQAQLRHPPFAGVADFLVRVERPSAFGDHAYEVWDAKLARRAKPHFLVQLCAYADLLAQVQGALPEFVRVVLGTRETKAFRTEDFVYFQRALAVAFLEFMAAFDPARPPLPEMGASHRRWQAHAERLLAEREHVSRVANITRIQVRRLGERAIETLPALASTALTHVPRIQDPVLARLKDQAALQQASQGQARPLYRVLAPPQNEPRKGLALLPPPSPLDVFFDIEGYPLVEGGLEYLFGSATLEDGEVAYRDWWAHDDAAEKRAFESFVDWATERWQRDLSLHIYHYAPYEVTALRRLMGRYGTREVEVDALLRAEVFVDLYAVVRGGLRVGEPAYSIKNLERLYLKEREAEVGSGIDSVAYYEAWIGGDEPPDWRRSPLLRAVRDYNREDCTSALRLAAWLRERQRESGIGFSAAKRDEKEEDEVRKPHEVDLANRELAEALLAGIPADSREPEREADRWLLQELLAQVLEFHRRERRPTWWSLYHRRDMTELERAEDLECLAGLERSARPPVALKRSFGFEYRFGPDQETKIRAGDTCRIAQLSDISVTVEELDLETGRALLKLGPKALDALETGEPPDRLCLILFDYVNAEKIARAIHEVARGWAEEGRLAPALENFLRRRTPCMREHAGGPLVREGEVPAEAVTRLAHALDDSDLCIQGPPGSGKTRSAAAAIVSLLREGKRVGISSNSHAAVWNLMGACLRQAGGELDCLKVGGDKDEEFFEKHPTVRHVAQGKHAPALLGTHRLVGGTAWAFCEPTMAGKLDHLFVDEAGQVSVANLIGMSRSASNLVLVGDQMQLAQPTQADHPGESGLSILDYLLEDHATIPPQLGVFLDRTWRLHPEICRFISGAVYEGRLAPWPTNANRVVRVPAEGGRRVRKEAGLVFLPCPHEGNSQASDEEVALVREVVAELTGREFTDETGAVRGRLTLGEILIVTPYNMQVNALKDVLGPAAKVGSVDRFQGQQAPVVLVSLCASDATSAPRGVDFLLDRNRLNVALSRAQSLAIVVGSPALVRTPCTTIRQMELVNLLCRIVEEGT